MASIGSSTSERNSGSAQPGPKALELSTASRILISEIDSPAQRARFDEVGARQAIIEITGMLRIGMLVSRNVLVTDAMLLDGSYFARLGPDRVLRELGASEARYPLVVTGTAPSLREGLEFRLANPDFRWSLKDVSTDTGAPAAIQENWEDWIRYVDDGIIQYEQQTRVKLELGLGAPPFTHDATPELIQALKVDPVRSSAWLAIEQAALPHNQKQQLLSWWNSGYLRMIAENAGADWITFEGSSSIPTRTRLSELQLPTKLIEWANEVSAPTVSVAWDSSRTQRTRLHKKPSWSRLRDLAYTATQVGEVVSRRSVLLDSAFKALIALVAIAVAVPGLDLSSADHPLTWVLFLGVVISTLPYDSLGALIALMKRDPSTALILYRREPTGG